MNLVHDYEGFLERELFGKLPIEANCIVPVEARHGIDTWSFPLL